MAAVQAIIRYGDIPSTSLLNESNSVTPEILVQSLTTSASRDEKAYMDARGVTFALEYRNPTISFAFDGYISNRTGSLSNGNPGEQIMTLANFTTDTFGFDPTDGVMVYLDPTRSETNEEIAKTTFTVKQYPFV